MKRPAACLLVVSLAALLLAGCGGGESSSETGSSQPPSKSGAPTGAVKQATAPRAPAGSKAVACRTGGGEVDQLRAAAIDCSAARTTMRRWRHSAPCRIGQGASRGSCSLGAYRCQAIEVDRGTAVSCARRGGDVSFIARRTG